jgi:hypothetical protein
LGNVPALRIGEQADVLTLDAFEAHYTGKLKTRRIDEIKDEKRSKVGPKMAKLFHRATNCSRNESKIYMNKIRV